MSGPRSLTTIPISVRHLKKHSTVPGLMKQYFKQDCSYKIQGQCKCILSFLKPLRIPYVTGLFKAGYLKINRIKEKKKKGFK